MNILINGESKTLPSDQDWSILQALEHLELPTKGVALALNQSVVPIQSWHDISLSSNDQLDVFTVVAGG